MRLEYFEMIDRIVDLDRANRTIRAEAQIPAESPIFEGHFPGHPLMPGVLLCEAMAQTSGWLILGTQKFSHMPFLVTLREAKFRNFVKPSQRLSLSAKMTHDGSGFAVTEARGEVDGKGVCDASITFRLAPFPTKDFEDRMKAFSKKIGFPLETVLNG